MAAARQPPLRHISLLIAATKPLAIESRQLITRFTFFLLHFLRQMVRGLLSVLAS